jgi:hypothetical protein
MSDMTTTVAKPNVYFGVVFELDGTLIPLEPKTAITDIKTNGIDCGLAPGQVIALGMVGQRLKAIFNTLGFQDTGSFLNDDGTIKTDVLPADIPGFSNLVNLLTSAELNIEAFHVKLPGTMTTDKTKYYTVGLSATWSAAAGKLFDGLDLNLRGVYFKVSNEGTQK